MKLIDGIRELTGTCIEIPDCSRNDLPELFTELGYKVGAEIGVYKGAFSEVLCKGGMKVYGIDPYVSYSDYEDTRWDNTKKYQEVHYVKASRRLLNYNYTFVRKKSMDAVKDFEDESLDFVYIDGNHEFQYVINDIYEWTKKVRKGGIIAGHDYIRIKGDTMRFEKMHVVYAVDIYTRLHNINPWYIIGRKHDEIRDVARSWFWFKQ
jgi:hypothetical protein